MVGVVIGRTICMGGFFAQDKANVRANTNTLAMIKILP